MKKIVKQIVGINVAQKELVVCLGRMQDDWSPELYAHKTFSNTQSGFAALLVWVKRLTQTGTPLRFVMEATGVYHELLAYFLEEKQYEVSVVLPSKISNYMRTLDTKTSTDRTASEAIAQFGLERKLSNWHRPKDIYKKLRQLTRERDQVVQERTEAQPHPRTIERIRERIALLDKQQKQI